MRRLLPVCALPILCTTRTDKRLLEGSSFLEDVSADDAKVLLEMLLPPSEVEVEVDGEGQSAERVRAAVTDWLERFSVGHIGAEIIVEALLGPDGIVDGLRRESWEGVEIREDGNGRKGDGATRAENETEGTVVEGGETREERTEDPKGEVHGSGSEYSSSAEYGTAERAVNAGEKETRQKQQQRDLPEEKKKEKKCGGIETEDGDTTGVALHDDGDTGAKEQEATEKLNGRRGCTDNNTDAAVKYKKKDQQKTKGGVIDFSRKHAVDWAEEISYGAWH